MFPKKKRCEGKNFTCLKKGEPPQYWGKTKGFKKPYRT